MRLGKREKQYIKTELTDEQKLEIKALIVCYKEMEGVPDKTNLRYSILSKIGHQQMENWFKGELKKYKPYLHGYIGNKFKKEFGDRYHFYSYEIANAIDQYLLLHIDESEYFDAFLYCLDRYDPESEWDIALHFTKYSLWYLKNRHDDKCKKSIKDHVFLNNTLDENRATYINENLSSDNLSFDFKKQEAIGHLNNLHGSPTGQLIVERLLSGVSRNCTLFIQKITSSFQRRSKEITDIADQIKKDTLS